MAERSFTLSIAQIHSLALKTMGFAPDHEVTIRAPYDDSTEIEFDIYHVRIGIDNDGTWGAYSRDDHGNADVRLSKGKMPSLGVRRPDGEPYPL